MSIPVGADTRYWLQTRINASVYGTELTARYGIYVPPPAPPLRHRPRPLPIDGAAYRRRTRNRRKK